MTALPLDLIVRATVLLAATALGDLLLRRRASAAMRHLLWSLVVAALLVLPLASALLPDLPVRIPIAVSPAGTAVPARPVASGAAGGAADCGGRGPTPCTPGDVPGRSIAITSAVPFAARPSWPAVAASAVPMVYLAGVLILLARLGLEPFALRRLTRASRDVVDPAWRGLLDESVRHARITRPVRLLQSTRDVMPLTFGSLAPAIVVPACADAWTEDRRRAVLLHELAHVARVDCLIQRLTAVACAIYWPHPGVWWAARRLRIERELACDDRVLAAGAPARDYAGHLLDLARSLGASPAPATALGMARARQLESRLLAILDEARHRASPGRAFRSVLVAAAILVVVPMAVLRAVIVPADPDSPSFSSTFTSAGQEFTGTWELHPSNDPQKVQVHVRAGRSNHGTTVALTELERLAGTTLATASTVHFPIRREAGTFTIDGTCRAGACAGTFVFEPSPTFGADLVKRGLERPTTQDQFHLAVADIGVAYLDTLAAAGYTRPDLRTLVRAAQHGVGAAYVTEMASLGHRLGTVERLITLRDHGVDPDYVRGMTAAGLARLSPEDLVRARDHGVDPEYVRGLAALGHGGVALDALVTARDHGIDPAYIQGMQGLGYRLTLDGFRQTRDHGVDPEYARGLTTLGYAGLSDGALVNARDHGVDPAYVRAMAELGYKGVPIDDLVRMRDHGVDPDYVRRLKQRGVTNLGVDEIIRRRDRGEE